MAKDRSGAEDEDDWQTPQWFYDKLEAEFNFDFDPCPINSTFDGLIIPWGKSNFINPPYNCRDKPRFIQKAFDEWLYCGKTCVLLIPAATGTAQFHDLILPHAEIRFQRGRITFIPEYLPRDISDKDLRKHLDDLEKLDGKKRSTKGKHDSMVVVFKGAGHAI